MKLSILQLNAYTGTYWKALSAFLKKNTFDILQFQELVGANTIVGNMNQQENTYEKLSALLGEDYQGRLFKTETFTSSPTSFDGVATFLRKDMLILEEKDIIQKEAIFPFDSKRTDYNNIGRGALALKVKKEGKIFWLLNTHLAWSPDDKDSKEKIRQAKILANFLEKLNEPFIFSGDLNVSPKTQTIQLLNAVGRNLTDENNVTNTLDEKLHGAQHLFPPGLAVDYIFVSHDITVENFSVINNDMSDHLGLKAKVAI